MPLATQNKKIDNLELRSEEVQEILTAPPVWMIRWGITVIFVMILMVIVGAHFIQYPDVIAGKATITTLQPPIKLVSKTNGYLERLYFKDKSTIKKGEVVAEITNPTHQKAIDYLSKIITTKTPPQDTTMVFGEIQTEYNQFLKNTKELFVLNNNTFYSKNILNLKKQIRFNQKLAFITQEQLVLMKEEIKNAHQKFETDSLLFAQGVIAKNEFYTNQTELLNKKQQYANTQKSYLQYQITASDYEKTLAQTTFQQEEKERDLENSLQSNIKNIENYILNWQQKYTLVAPVEGTVSFLTSISENQFIQAQTPIFAIVPKNQELIGLLQIPTQGYGKIKIGQKVRIKLDNYPAHEYGQIVGEVGEIALIPTENKYLIQIALPNDLTTTYKKELEYIPEMVGSAEIITEKLSILDRIFDKFRSLMDK